MPLADAEKQRQNREEKHAGHETRDDSDDKQLVRHAIASQRQDQAGYRRGDEYVPQVES